VIAVTGPPGCGKSTFLRGVIRAGVASSATVLRVRRHASLHRRPGADWGVTVRDAERHDVALPRWDQREPEADLQARVVAARCRLVADEPAHPAGATRRLVLAVAARASSHPILVVTAFDATPAGSVAATTRDVLCGAARSVSRLDSSDAKAWREFVATRLGTASASDALVDFLRARTSGNPRLAVELLADLRASGALRPADDAWVFRPERASESLPPMSARWLGRALAGLAPARRELLRAAAVGGLRFRADALARVIERPPLEVLQELHTIGTERGVIAREEGLVWSFQPALLSELLCDEIVLEQRRALHVRFAGALSELAPDDATIGSHW